MKQGYTYILKCSDGSFYVGSTSDLSKRILQHEHSIHDGYTKSRRPISVIFTESFPSIDEAIIAERQVKKWSRAKKMALIKGDFDLLKDLARGRHGHMKRNRI